MVQTELLFDMPQLTPESFAALSNILRSKNACTDDVAVIFELVSNAQWRDIAILRSPQLLGV